MLNRRTFLAAVGPALAAPRLAHAEDDPRDLLYSQGRYLPAWKGLQDKTLKASPSYPAQFAAFLGDEATAMAGAVKQQNPTLSPPDGPLRVTDAIQRIVQASQGRQVVILNEAHVCSRHRAFLARLLAALRPQGFTHFAAETFVNEPGRPNISSLKPGDAFNPDMGNYTFDPVFAEAVRQSLDLGYRLLSYEVRNDQHDPAKKTGPEVIAEREGAEAANLAAILAANPKARLLIHVGYSHLREGLDLGGNSWMARRLKALTGIDPLTVSQSSTGSFGPHAPDGPLTQAILKRFAPRKPIIVETAARVCIGAGMDTADLAVFHPALPDSFGRPGWLAVAPGRRRITAPLPAFEGQTLIQAIHAGDPEACVPADQYLLQPGDKIANLYLRPGRYRLRLETLAGLTPLGEVTA